MDDTNSDTNNIFLRKGGADAAKFDVSGGNLVFKTAPDFETDPHSYQVEVTAKDGLNTTPETITVNLTDVNDNAPVITTAATQTVAENTTLVAALTSTDADTVATNPATFSITGRADAAKFDVTGGNLVFKTSPDFETDPHNYQVEVTASDGLHTVETLKTIGSTLRMSFQMLIIAIVVAFVIVAWHQHSAELGSEVWAWVWFASFCMFLPLSLFNLAKVSLRGTKISSIVNYHLALYDSGLGKSFIRDSRLPQIPIEGCIEPVLADASKKYRDEQYVIARIREFS